MPLHLMIYDPERTRDWTFTQRGERTLKASEEGCIVIDRPVSLTRHNTVDSRALAALVTTICQSQSCESLLLGVGRLPAVRPEFLNPSPAWKIVQRGADAFIYRIPREGTASLAPFYEKVALHGQEWFFWWGSVDQLQLLVGLIEDMNPASLRRAAPEGATVCLDVETGAIFGVFPRGPKTEDLVASLILQGIARYAEV